MTEAEDAEEAQARARMLAFEQSPEGRARRRIDELDSKGGKRRSARRNNKNLMVFASATRSAASASRRTRCTLQFSPGKGP